MILVADLACSTFAVSGWQTRVEFPRKALVRRPTTGTRVRICYRTSAVILRAATIIPSSWLVANASRSRLLASSRSADASRVTRTRARSALARALQGRAPIRSFASTASRSSHRCSRPARRPRATQSHQSLPQCCRNKQRRRRGRAVPLRTRTVSPGPAGHAQFCQNSPALCFPPTSKPPNGYIQFCQNSPVLCTKPN
jgi:hypothetical protein